MEWLANAVRLACVDCARCEGTGLEPSDESDTGVACFSCDGSGVSPRGGHPVYLAMNAATGRAYSSTDGAAPIVYIAPGEELSWQDSWRASRSFPRPLRECPPREMGQR